MLENLRNFFKKMGKKEEDELLPSSSDAAKERLHLVLMQDRANVSVDFLDLMKREIIDVIKKYIDVDENGIDVRFTNQINEDGTNGAPALYANIPIVAIRNDKKSEMERKNQNLNGLEQQDGGGTDKVESSEKASDLPKEKSASHTDDVDKEPIKKIESKDGKVVRKISKKGEVPENLVDESDGKKGEDSNLEDKNSKKEENTTSKKVASATSRKKATTTTKRKTASVTSPKKSKV